MIRALLRDLAGTALIFGTAAGLDFLGIAIHTPAGAVGRLEGSMRAIMSAMYVENLAGHIRRGQAGVIRDGRNAGGRAYGYRPVPGQPGELVIEPAEAETLRRIFRDYAGGRSPRAIAHALNAEGIAPPRGNRWSASTLNGNARRGHGILQNSLYAGELVWNRVRMIKDPDTGRRVSRPNPAGEWQRADAPHLRIIDADLWTAVQERRRQRSIGPQGRRRCTPRHLLSGLLRCGECGGGLAVRGSASSNKAVRIGCSAARESGTCGNRRTLNLAPIERAVIEGLREQLRDPALIAEYVRSYNAERRRLAAEAVADRARLERDAARAQGELDRALDALLRGLVRPESLRDRIAALEAEVAATRESLALCRKAPEPVALHPAAIDRYQADLEDLQGLLQAAPDGRTERLRASVRRIIDSVIVTPGAPWRPSAIEVRGRLGELVGAPLPPARSIKVGGVVVAEARYHHTHHSAIGLFTFRCAA